MKVQVPLVGILVGQFAQQRGWKRVGILYGRNAHGDSASDQFQTQATEHGVMVPFSRSYLEEPDPATEDFRPLVAEIRKQQFDAIMLADVFPWAGRMIQDLAKMGVRAAVIGRVGGDVFGRVVAELLGQSGVDVSLLRVSPGSRPPRP